jgi:Ser/Thr protein kinase RdoA (MazF antagonist)
MPADFAEGAQPPEAHSEPVVAFLAGYRECRPLTDEELEAFPLFARAHALITLARLTRGREERVSEEWPEWARLLRVRLDAVADDLRAALLSSSSLSP